ncbi:MAG: hypothetical protein ABI855_14625 [Bacteroidota bacterium]
MEKLNKKEITGIILMIVSVIFFSIFIWWGTTSYKPDFAVGIIIMASGIFMSGILTFNITTKSKDKT